MKIESITETGMMKVFILNESNNPVLGPSEDSYKLD